MKDSANDNPKIDRGRTARIVPFCAALVCLAPFVPLLIRGDAVVSDAGRDYAVMHLPLAEFEREELLAGRLPLWNPYVACGQPFQAVQLGLPFYPIASVLCLICGANRGLEICLFLHLGLCFAGAYWLARRLALSAAAAAYAGLVTTWNGALIGHLVEGHAGGVFSAALVPWFFLGLDNLLNRPSAVASVWLAIGGAACALAAMPQILYYTVVGGMLWTAGSVCCGSAAARRWRAVAWGAVALTIALLLAAVQLAPVLELMRDGLVSSGRGTDQFAANFALDGADAARLLMPYLNGTPFAGVTQFSPFDHYWERVVYLGAATPVLAVYGLSRAGTRKWQWGAAYGVVAALAVAFGDSTPAFSLLGHAVPGLLLFRCPGRVFYVAALPAALLAGRGLDALASGERRAPPSGFFRLAAVLLAGLAIPAYAACRMVPEFDWRRYTGYAFEHLSGELALWAVVAFDTAVVIVLAARRSLSGWAVALPLIALAALDLGYFNVGNFQMSDREPARADRARPADLMTRGVEAVGLHNLTYDGLRYSHWTAAAIVQHRLAVNTYDGGVLPAATARLYRAIENDSRPALALAGCGYISSSAGEATRLRDDPLPHIRFLPDGLKSGELPVERITLSDIGEMRRHLVPVRLIEASPRELIVEVTARVDGWLIAADTYYPGWICRVDGQMRPIECAHGVFRRVRLEAGRHKVAMTYRPLSFRIGLAATLSGIVIAAAVLLAPIMRRKRRQTP